MKINYSDQKIIKGKKSIFLAGPTPRDNNILSLTRGLLSEANPGRMDTRLPAYYAAL